MNLSNLKKITFASFISLFILTSCSDKSAERDSQGQVESESLHDKPDFAAFTDVKVKKAAFFDYIYFYVEKVNLEVLERRITIEAILEKDADQITAEDKAFIDEMSELYLKDHDSSDTLASARILQDYVRVVPPSLALAQAANESAWGTSRFATAANNYFGQWCFSKGCGLVPSQRNSGKVHEVRKFESPEGSVRSYIRNLNTHYTYEDLREIRGSLYNEDKLITGIDLAEGLKGYSERGEEYVKELQSMIRFNKLTKFDKAFWKSVEEK